MVDTVAVASRLVKSCTVSEGGDYPKALCSSPIPLMQYFPYLQLPNSWRKYKPSALSYGISEFWLRRRCDLLADQRSLLHEMSEVQ